MKNSISLENNKILLLRFVFGAGLFGLLIFAGVSGVAAQQKPLIKSPKSRPAQTSGGRQSNHQVTLKKSDAATLARVKSKLAKKQAQKQFVRFDKPREAAEFYLKKRLPEGEKTLPLEKYLEAKEDIERMPLHSTAKDRILTEEERAALDETPLAERDPNVLGTWSPLGPGNIGGRTRALLVHPTTPTTMYAAGVAGGVWKTTNSGTSWTALNDTMANLAVTTLTFDPANPETIYAGTGEGFGNGGAVRGLGIFKTTNGGAAWTQIVSTNNSNFHYIMDVVVSPVNSQRIYVATSHGIQRSLNGGASWTLVVNEVAYNGCSDLAIRTDQPTDYIFAACGLFAEAGVYRNTDAGGAGTWDYVLLEAGMSRTSLAIAPSNQNVIYAMASSLDYNGNYGDGLHAVFRSTTGGGLNSWTAQVRNTNATKLNTVQLTNPLYAFGAQCFSPPGNTNQFYNQGWYDNVIAVDPSDSNIVWTGGIDLMRSNNGGVTWGLASYWWLESNNSRYAHADNHAIVFHPQYNGTSNKTMFVGSDGGIFRTLDARATTGTNPCSNTGSVVWTNLNNGYGVTQFYNGAVYPDGNTYFGGTQDNGTIRGTNAGGIIWNSIAGGDGGYVAVNPTNTQIVYAEFTDISIHKSTDGGANFVPATTGIVDVGLFINPFTMDPSNPQRLWTSGTKMWRTANAAANWTQASAAFASKASAIAVAPGNGNTVFAGTEGGVVHRTNAALTATSATTWSSTTPRAAYVSSVAVDPNNINTVYATYSTFGGVKVYKSTNGGVSFTPSGGSGATALPDVPAHSLVVNPANSAQLYVGTDSGVFYSPDGGATWMAENTGFPNTVVEWLTIGSVGGTPHLFAFTHGRSVWRVSLTAVPTAAPVAVGGRVTSAAGRGVGSARVTMTDSRGAIRTALTNPRGYYRFEDVAVGETYAFSVSAKRHSFGQQTQVQTIRETIEDINFVAAD